MGNSEHGCVCMKSQERVRARNIWKHSYLSSLELLYQKGNKWAESLCAIILIWDSNLDNAFKNSNRWQFFLSRECEKSALEYHAYPAHRNLFKELELDFKDTRNPIGAVIVQFSQCYTDEYLDGVRETLLQNNLENALSYLEKFYTEIFGVIDILIEASLNFYICINKILNKRLTELKGMILSQIISGELYRLIYDLSLAINNDKILKVSSISKYLSDSEIDKKLLGMIRQISTSESPYEKLHHLFYIKNYIEKKKLSNLDVDKYLWVHIYESKVRDIFIHLYIIDYFAVNTMESSFEVFDKSLRRSCDIKIL